ncbi:PAS domain S-box protein [Methanosarcina sp. KYL-1]|uniref:PAS domain-containing protein n=1 Tax=Methanosarcina sp. KYL-1 TaxID=2602068 RepID=UPI002100E4D2|nr:PAS domain-containing protein [Methanosarcina sp. KYL-1]MCQ1535896.1 PAS domain S-box protein [Methanosarcina sp. KYL-1]
MGSENSRDDNEIPEQDSKSGVPVSNERGEALREALEREKALKTIINNSPVVVFLWKNEEKWPAEFVSENVTQLGYAVEDFVSGRVLYGDIILPEDLPKVEEKLERRIMEGARDFSMEYRIRTKAGDMRWVNERTFIQRDPDGKVSYFQGIVMDVTGRKMSEDRLKKALEMQEIMKTVINNSPAVVFLWENKENWPAVFVSENVTQIGYLVEDFISGKVLYGQIIHPDDLPKVEKELEERITEGAVDFNMEYRIFTKAGDLRWVNERTFIHRNEEGEVIRFEGIVLDVTGRKENEEALKKALEMQEALKTVINNSPAVVFLWRNEENWPAELVSENVTQFGYTAEDFLSGKVLYGSIVHRDDIAAVTSALENCIREGHESFEMEYRIFTRKGNMRWVDERTFIQRDSEGKATHFQGIVVDVTERKEAGEMLEIQRELGMSLSTTWNLQAMLKQILNACLRINGLDAGGIYLKDELLDQINLVAHGGISSEFVEKVLRYKADSREARQIWTEKPVYKLDFYSEKMGDAVRKEGITAVAIIPLNYRGEIIGSLNFASRTLDKIPRNIRNFLESVALQVVNHIGPIRIEADLA